MKKYEKPMVLAAEELAEGVYAASGADCFTPTVKLDSIDTLAAEGGLKKYTFNIGGDHDTTHIGNECRFRVTFDEPVTLFQVVDSCPIGSTEGSVGTVFEFSRSNLHYNGVDRISMGSLVVTTMNPNLNVPKVEVYYCNGAQ